MTIYTPYWWEEAPRPDPPQTALADDCDVAIIGAGYTGLAAAIELARAGRSVQVFDKSRAGEAASSRSGGIGSGNLRLSFAKKCWPAWAGKRPRPTIAKASKPAPT
jgi:2-polyprenyl-6-methoxyphenol hydroxylase-like FAD-dependent oxidoreductase